MDAVESHLEELLGEVLTLLGADLESVHMQGTPHRVAKTFLELTNPADFNFTTFENADIKSMVVIQDIPFYSLCAHHLLPFHGKAHVAYIPNKQLAGLSKIGRSVKAFSRGFNVQEELTEDIKDFLEEKLEPKGVAVILRAHHLCMQMRGAELPGFTTTSALSGVFLDPGKGAREEFLRLVDLSSWSL